jgi:hypothetical protein
VLDQQQRQTAFDKASDQVDDVMRFLRHHPLRRLVQNQQARIGRQSAGDFDAPLIAVWQFARQAIAVGADADPVQQCLRPVTGFALFGTVAR